MDKANEISDETIAKAAGGSVEAFENIYKKYFSFVVNVAYRMVNNRDDAQEVAQEAFINIYRKLQNFRFESSLKTWIYRIAINCAINHSKKMSKERANKVEYDENLETEYSSFAKEDQGEKEDVEKIVSGLLDALNPDQRACIVLRSINGLSYQEIAEALQVPINTVRSRIKRARETMLALKKEAIPHGL